MFSNKYKNYTFSLINKTQMKKINNEKLKIFIIFRIINNISKNYVILEEFELEFRYEYKIFINF